MLRIVAAVIVVFWLLGVIFGIAGNLVHRPLFAALVVLWNLITGRRTV